MKKNRLNFTENLNADLVNSIQQHDSGARFVSGERNAERQDYVSVAQFGSCEQISKSQAYGAQTQFSSAEPKRSKNLNSGKSGEKLNGLDVLIFHHLA